MVPLVRDLGLPSASRGSLGVKLRWFGPPLSVCVLLLSPCFCLWPILFSLRGDGSFFFSHLSLNLSTDMISHRVLASKKKKNTACVEDTLQQPEGQGKMQSLAQGLSTWKAWRRTSRPCCSTGKMVRWKYYHTLFFWGLAQACKVRLENE